MLAYSIHSCNFLLSFCHRKRYLWIIDQYNDYDYELQNTCLYESDNDKINALNVLIVFFVLFFVNVYSLHVLTIVFNINKKFYCHLLTISTLNTHIVCRIKLVRNFLNSQTSNRWETVKKYPIHYCPFQWIQMISVKWPLCPSWLNFVFALIQFDHSAETRILHDYNHSIQSVLMMAIA